MQVFDVIDGHMHDDWTGDVINGSDIAVLKLDREAADLTLPRLGSGDVPLRRGQLLSAIGWGRTESEYRSQVLRLADRFVVVDHKLCDVQLQGVDLDSWICAGTTGQDTCRGHESWHWILSTRE